MQVNNPIIGGSEKNIFTCLKMDSPSGFPLETAMKPIAVPLKVQKEWGSEVQNFAVTEVSYGIFYLAKEKKKPIEQRVVISFA